MSKYLSQSEARASIFFSDRPENTKMSQLTIDKGGHSDFHIGPKNKYLVEDAEILLLSNFVEFRSAVSEEKSEMSQPIRGWGGQVCFSDRPEKLKLGRGILLPVKFDLIPLSFFSGEIKNDSANQRPGRPSCFVFFDWLEKYKLGRGR